MEVQEQRLQKDEGKVMRELEDLKRKFKLRQDTTAATTTARPNLQLNISNVKSH